MSWKKLMTSVTRCKSKKEVQMFLKVAQIVAASVYTYSGLFSKLLKSHQSFWATFISKFVAKNYQKSPNLATLS